jgi:hypothetical protein
MVLAGLISGISVVGGVLAHVIDSEQFSLLHGIWWAFLRLTDPGYLGDDDGIWLRVLSTVITVAGYVVFLGAFVAILTQWLQRTIRALESGTQPYVGREHIVILGTTTRTPVILRQLLGEPPGLKRFLRRHHATRLRIAVLADDASRATADFKSQLGPIWDPGKVVVRSGSPLRSDQLARIDPTHAASIIVPADDFLGREIDIADSLTIKTLLSLDKAAAEDPDSPPLVIAELRDTRATAVARASYRGPLQLVAGDSMIGRILAQSVRSPGVSRVVGELLAHNQGNEIFVRQVTSSEVGPVNRVVERLDRGILLGLIRGESGDESIILNVCSDIDVEQSDRLIVLAKDRESTESRRKAVVPSVRREKRLPGISSADRVRLLILGWNRRVPALLSELGKMGNERYEVTVASRVSVEHRERVMSSYIHSASIPECSHVLLDYGLPDELQTLLPGNFDRILMIASDWLETGEQADARTIAAALLVRETTGSSKPPVVLELAKADNATLIPQNTGELVITPNILSFVLTQVALRHELGMVFDALFAAGGTEIAVLPRDHYQPTREPVTFSELEQLVAKGGHTALGFFDQAGELQLNPRRDALVPESAAEIVSVVTNE